MRWESKWELEKVYLFFRRGQGARGKRLNDFEWIKKESALRNLLLIKIWIVYKCKNNQYIIFQQNLIYLSWLFHVFFLKKQIF